MIFPFISNFSQYNKLNINRGTKYKIVLVDIYKKNWKYRWKDEIINRYIPLKILITISDMASLIS